LLAFRKYLSWIYLLTALVCVRIVVGIFVAIASPQHLHLSPRAVFWTFLMVVFTGVFSTAWWMSLNSRSSARAWGLAASSLYIFTAFLGSIFAHRLLAANPLLLVIGIVGLAAFAKRQKAILPVNTEEVFSIPGDFTSSHLNRIALAVTFGLSLGAYLWWQGWLKGQHITALDSAGVRFTLTLIVLLSITSIHETGHAVVGMMCGMKLRAFFIGPFQWRIRDAKWEFEFKPKGLILADGVTALIPGNGKLVPGQYLSMMAAGSISNVLSGSLALFIALALRIALPAQLIGFLTLFGLWSLALASANLLPFRTPQGYSDGAIVLQILAGGAFAKFHLSLAQIGSSLVSSLRPRDYDIRSIRSAARGIAEGRQALMMWLYAFSHSIDAGKTQEADEVLANAELVCLQSVPNIPAELHTTFIFGNALVRRDAKATRFWWNRMQAKNPTRFNADYWRAQSALHWIEGNLEEARSALEKSHTLAEQLPHVGAYDFGRHCCSLLRHELDLASAA
jgi:hypothetical protein